MRGAERGGTGLGGLKDVTMVRSARDYCAVVQ